MPLGCEGVRVNVDNAAPVGYEGVRINVDNAAPVGGWEEEDTLHIGPYTSWQPYYTGIYRLGYAPWVHLSSYCPLWLGVTVTAGTGVAVRVRGAQF